ncbi:TPA: hypothetical protein ACMWSP_000285 [Neisseria gonorrhoeae]
MKNDDTSLGKQTEKMEKYFAEAANKKNECRPGCARPFGTAAFPFGRQRGRVPPI